MDDNRQAHSTSTLANNDKAPNPKQISNQDSVIASPHPVFFACTAGALVSFPFAIAVQFVRRIFVAGLAIHHHVCHGNLAPPPLLFGSNFPRRL